MKYQNIISINFIDLNVSIPGSHMITDLHFKETDHHQYLHYQSSHPEHIQKSMVYSPVLRLKRKCTFEKDLHRYLFNMKEWFLAGGYPEKMIKEQMKRVVLET